MKSFFVPIICSFLKWYIQTVDTVEPLSHWISIPLRPDEPFLAWVILTASLADDLVKLCILVSANP
jgi:hypothetical protein